MADPAENEDIAFRHYTLTHRLTAWVSSNLFDGITYTVRHGLLKGMKRKGGLGWVPEQLSPGITTAEHVFWEGLNLDGLTVYDVGSFHGLLALFFSTRAKQVVCFEPNSRNNKRLMENIALNKLQNVRVCKVGVGSRSETMRMVGNPLIPGGASLDEKAQAQMLRSGAETVVEEISIITLDEEIQRAGLPAPDFIKIDIEGWEIEALKGARQTLASYKPTLFLEMHGGSVGEKKRKVAEIVEFLWDLNYRNIRHIESETAITPSNSAIAMQGHLYCKPS